MFLYCFIGIRNIKKLINGYRIALVIFNIGKFIIEGCRAETPILAEVYNQYKDKGFQVLGVATWDQPKDTKKAIEDLKITWPQILNAQNTPSELYGFNGIPHIILFGPDGTIV